MLWAVIMAGGKGTRFWPESREKLPKQFLSLFGSKSLLQQTAQRLSGVVPRDRIIVVTQADKVSLVKRTLNLTASQVIGEPVGRNTAPCLVLAAKLISRRDPDAVLAVLPADHLIEKQTVFKASLKAAASAARTTGLPVTFGIKPSFPSTGYGYLETGAKKMKAGKFPIYGLKRFCEKPVLSTARKFCRSKKFLWNSGMFVWKASDVLECAQKHLPEAVKVADKIAKSSINSGMRRYFPKMPSISIDYGLMEKLKGKILAIPVDFGWNDVGSWKVLGDLLKQDRNRNVVDGPAVSIRSRGNYVKAHGRLVAMVGVQDMVVVDAGDALLICPKSETESIREIVDQLKSKNMTRYL